MGVYMCFTPADAVDAAVDAAVDVAALLHRRYPRLRIIVIPERTQSGSCIKPEATAMMKEDFTGLW